MFDGGSSAELSYGFETSEGLRGSAETFLPFASESLIADRPVETNPNLDPSNLETEPRNLMANGGGSIKLAPDVNSILRMRVQHRGFASSTELVAAGGGDPAVRRWLVRNKERTDSPMSKYVDSLFFNLDRNDGNPHLITGAKGTVATWRITEGKFVDFEQAYLFARQTDMGDPIPDVGNNVAFTGDVFARGQRNDPESADPLHVTVSTAGALDGTAKVQFTLGSGVAAGPEYAVVSGRPIQVLIGADSEDPGSPQSAESVEVIFVEGDPSDVLTLGDTWEIPNVRTMASPVYSTSRQLTAVGARALVTIGGVQKEYALHDATIVYTRPMKLNTGIGSKYAFGVIPNGKESCTITLARDYTDLDFYRALYQERAAAFTIPMLGDSIRTGYRERWQLDVAHARVTRAGASVTTQTALPETIDVRAFRPAGSTDPLLLETIDNTITAL